MASRPLVIAHRGASGTLPENTKLAFAKAIDLGADAIEFDLQLTADGVAIVIHDETLDRTTTGSGRVSETTFDEIRALDAGSWFAASFAGLEVPTLEEVLDALGSQVLLNIELKPDERVDKLVRHAVTAVARFELFGSVVFSSFNARALEALRHLVPDARIGVLALPGELDERFDLAGRLEAEVLCPTVAMVDSELVRRAHRARLQVWAWTANLPGEIRLLSALGIDGIFTDYPDRI